ncbi:uncharacterized protein B0H18DRAFT_375711 [Fomitopsis serialis]|uniref:uncharacterized protein n=1 Tax=Fomitopsis serialis TaxID=139415 RepID=UPI0020075307|nr:uncharacterized protein B0H18DRAFT_375711 [Neoantrodia serialis]KAH9925529.1 hypothetical protein B0H18DRAFT_375711 [Neoantrodia serialis]
MFPSYQHATRSSQYARARPTNLSYIPQYDRYGGCSLRSCWENHSSDKDYDQRKPGKAESDTYQDIADVLHVCTCNKASRPEETQTVKGTHGRTGSDGRDMKEDTDMVRKHNTARTQSTSARQQHPQTGPRSPQPRLQLRSQRPSYRQASLVRANPSVEGERTLVLRFRCSSP